MSLLQLLFVIICVSHYWLSYFSIKSKTILLQTPIMYTEVILTIQQTNKQTKNYM